MNTSTSQEQDSAAYDPLLDPGYWKRELRLSAAQAKHLTVPMMNQLARCKDDDARRILMNARMQGHEWRKAK